VLGAASIIPGMHSRNLLNIAILGLFSLLAACSSAGSTDEPRTPAEPEFDGTSLTRALSVADATGRNVLVEYSSESCPFCQKMEKGALSDPKVKAGLAEVVYVRVRKGENSESYEARWGKRKTPTFFVLKPDGSEASSLVTGSVGTKDFTRFVAWAKTAEGPEPVLKKGGS
jgi:thioredoxin-related protein